MDTSFLFETERLIVQRFMREDADAFFQLNGNDTVMRYIRPAKSRADSDAFLQENIHLYHTGSSVGRFAVFEKNTRQFCGSFSCLYLSGETNFHIGYAFVPAAWGKGFATELVKKGISYWFASNHPNVLFAITDPANMPSQRVLMKAGFLFQKQIIDTGKLVDLFYINRSA